MKLKKYLYESVKYALRSYPIIRPYIKEVEQLYAMTPEQLRARNEKRFLEIFHRAYDKSPFYHKLYTEAGIKKKDIKTIDDIKKLPVITKDMVKQHADEMLTVPPLDGDWSQHQRHDRYSAESIRKLAFDMA